MFGDSFTTPDNFVKSQDSFWGLTADELGIEKIINCSRPVNSFTSVQHLLVGMSQQIDWQKDLVFVGIPPLERITVFDNHKNTHYAGHEIDATTWNCIKFDILNHRGLLSLQNYGEDRLMIIHNDRSWVETDALRQIFLLTKWLDGIDANYLVLNLSRDLDIDNVWGPSEFILDYCKQHPRCILFENTYHGINIDINKPADFDEYGWNGHHGADGNQRFFEKSLLPKLKEVNLC